MKKHFLYLLFLLCSYNSIACLNGINFADIVGVNYRNKPLRWVMDLKRSDYQKSLAQLERRYLPAWGGKMKRADAGSSLALIYVYQGKYEKAKNLLFFLKDFPDPYSVAANLGVVYELTGNNDSAAYFVEKALNIYPDSHENSEWIHLRLIRAKQMETFRPGDHLLEIKVLKFGRTGREIIVQEGNEVFTADKLLSLISYQLHERMIFVKPQDLYVADLLLTMAELYRLKSATEAANECYKLAAEYDPAIRQLCEEYISEKRTSYLTILDGKQRRMAEAAAFTQKKIAIAKAAQARRTSSAANLKLANMRVEAAKREMLMTSASIATVSVLILLLIIVLRKIRRPVT